MILKRLFLFNKVFDECRRHFYLQNLYENTRVFKIFLISMVFFLVILIKTILIKERCKVNAGIFELIQMLLL